MADFQKPQHVLVARQVAQRNAVKAAWERSKLVVSRQTFGPGGISARVLYEGEYFDVGERDLAKLKAGKTPAELGLEPNYDDNEL